MVLRRPRPDAGVDSAVESATSNVKMKRMALFGLRALSELCTPPRGRYRENALRAVEINAVAGLSAIMANFPSDEEIAELVLKTCWGISCGLLEYRDAELLAQFLGAEGAAAACTAINAIPQKDSDLLAFAFQTIRNFQTLEAPLPPSELAPGLAKAVTAAAAGGAKLAAAAEVCAAISAVASTPHGAAALYHAGALAPLMEVCSSFSGHAELADVLIGGIGTVGRMTANSGEDPTATILFLKSLVEENKGRKRVEAACSAGLAQLLTQEQLTACLQSLDSSDAETRATALELLGAMTYVTEFATAIVQAGSVPLLIKAVARTVAEMGKAGGAVDDSLARSLAGTVTLLGRIARNREFAKEVYNGGGLAAVGSALQATAAAAAPAAAADGSPSPFSACCAAMAALVAASESFAVEAYQSFSLGTTVLTALYEHADDPKLHAAALECVSALCAYEILVPHLVEDSAAEIVSYAMQYDADSYAIQMPAFRALERLAPAVYTTASIHEYGGLLGIAQTIAANAAHEDFAQTALRATETLAGVPDVKQFATDGALVDAVLAAMLEHSKNAAVQKSGVSILEALATQADADRHSAALAGAMARAEKDPAAALSAIAAANGLCRVKRMLDAFEQSGAPKHLAAGIEKLVMQEKVGSPGSRGSAAASATASAATAAGAGGATSEKLLAAAADTMSVFATHAKKPLDEAFLRALRAFAGRPREVGEIAKRSPAAVDKVYQSLAAVAASGRLEKPETVQEAVAAVLSGLKAAGDDRHVVEGLLSQLAPLLAADASAVSAFISNGGVPVLASAVKLSQFNARAQAAGFRAVAAVLARDPKAAAAFVSADFVSVIHGALRAQAHDSEIRKVVGPLVSLLIPGHQLDEMARTAVADAQGALKAAHPATIIAALQRCADIGVSADGARALARHGGDDLLQRVAQSAEAAGSDEALTLGCQLGAQIAAQRTASASLVAKRVAAISEQMRLANARALEDAAGHSLRAAGFVARTAAGRRALRDAGAAALVANTCAQFGAARNPELFSVACNVLGGLVGGGGASASDVAAVGALLGTITEAVRAGNLPREQLAQMCQNAALLLADAPPEAARLAADAGLVEAVYQVLAGHAEDAAVAEPASAVLRLAAEKLGADAKQSMRAEGSANWDIREIGETLAAAITANIKNTAVVQNLASCAGHILAGGEPGVKESGFLEALRDAVISADGADKVVLEKSAREFLDKFGAPKGLPEVMQQLQAAVEGSDRKSAKEALEKLNFHLLGHVENPDVEFAEEKKTWGAMAAQFAAAHAEGDAPMIRALANAAKLMVEQGAADAKGKRGAGYFAKTLLPPLCAMLNDSSEGGLAANPALLTTAFQLLGAAAAASPAAAAECATQLSAPRLFEMLEANQADADLCASLLQFVTRLHPTEGTAGNDYGGAKREVLDTLARILAVHRGRVAVIAPACEVAGGLVAAMAVSGAEPPTALANGSLVAAADGSHGASAGMQTFLHCDAMNALAAMAAHPMALAEIKKGNYVVKCGAVLDLEAAAEPAAAGAGAALGAAGASAAEVALRNNAAFLRLCEAVALQAGGAVHIREKGGLARCAEIITAGENDPTLMLQGVKTLAALANGDPVGCGRVIGVEILPQLIGEIGVGGAPGAGGPLDPGAGVGKLLLLGAPDGATPTVAMSEAVVLLMQGLVSAPRGEEILRSDELKAALAAAGSALSGSAATKEAYDMAQGLISRQMIELDPEDPTAITLRQIHDWLAEKIAAGESINVTAAGADPLLLERFTIVFSKMSDYCALKLTVNDFAGQQSEYGCRSWLLWLEQDPLDVLPTYLEWDVPTLLLNYINTQVVGEGGAAAAAGAKDVSLATMPSAVLAAIAARDRETANAGKHCAGLSGVAASLVFNLQAGTATPGTFNDTHIIPRVDCIEQVAINRTLFTAPEAVEALVKVWDAYDRGQVSSLALRHTFRALRRIVCDSHTEVCTRLRVVERLCAELAKDAENALLIDGFFLLGILAVDHKLKSIAGTSGAVEMALQVMRNHMSDAPGEGVVTNVQLALANLVVGHKRNTNALIKNNGLALNVKVLQDRAEYFDETNAAAALLTNACFRREDVKALYGGDEIRAPAALAHAISCYDGGTDEVALRCLNNMFKAISNMSLFTPNVEKFLDSGLETAYYSLLSQADNLPDDVVKTGLFTLSNLTWENREENMSKFGIIVPPLIQMASGRPNADPGLLAWSLETLVFLCRLPENAHQFAEYGGCELAMTLIEAHGRNAISVLQHGLAALGTCARLKENLPSVLAANAVPTLVRVLEGFFFEGSEASVHSQHDVSVNALRVISRMNASGRAEVLAIFVQERLVATAMWYVQSLAQNEEPTTLLTVESMRTLLSCLAIAQGDNPESYQRLEDVLDQYEVGEKKKGLFGFRKKAADKDDAGAEDAPLTRPEGPRAIEKLGVSDEEVANTAAAIGKVVQVEALSRNGRFLRFALGILCFIAVEDIGPSAVAGLPENLNAIARAMAAFVDSYRVDRKICILLIDVIGNLAYRHPALVRTEMGTSSDIYKRMTDIGKKIGSSEKEKIEKERGLKLKARLDDLLLAWKLIIEGDEGSAMRKFAAVETDFGMTEWARDPYPNGVHDLPMKEELRRGGRFKIIVDERNRESWFWRANQTLNRLQWRIEKDKNVEMTEAGTIEFEAGVNVSRITAVARGLANDLLVRASKRQRGVSAELCFVIQGPPSEDYPQGFDFGIKCKTKQERDQFLEWLLEWRDACTY